MGARAILSNRARSWDTLNQVQREAWNAAALFQRTHARRGQSGPLTGLQFFVKINATLAQFGQECVNIPPASPIPGVSVCAEVRVIGTVPAPVLGSSDITALYTAKFGVPPVGTKVFVQCNQCVNGFQSIPVSFWAIVPAHR